MSNKTLIYIHNDNGTSEEEISSEGFYIGRSDRAEVTVKNDLLSRKHIKVKNQLGILSIQDLDTTNGTFLNGKKLEAHEWYEIHKEDEVKIGNGNIVLNICLEDDESDEEKNQEESFHDEDATSVVDLNEYNRTKELNSSHFSSGKTAAESMSKGSNGLVGNLERTNVSYRPTTSFNGNASLKQDEKTNLDDVVFSPVVEGNLKDILNKVDQSRDTEFSEIELLEIKKIEIESQVKALKIKEESEYEAKRIIEKSLAESQRILDKSNSEAIEMVKNASEEASSLKEDAIRQADDIYDDAKDEASEIIEKAQEKLEGINKDISDSLIERDSLREKVENLLNKVSDSLEQKNNYEMQSDGLKAKIVEEEKRIDELVAEREETTKKVQKEIKTIEDQLSQLYHERDEATGKLDQQNREFFSLKGQKEIIETEIHDLKNKEINLNQAIEKNEQRVDKFYKDKEILIEETKNLEERVNELSRDITGKDQNIVSLEKLIIEKEDYLKNIEQKAQNYYLSEKNKYDKEVAKLRSDGDREFKEKVFQNEQTAKEILDSAQNKAEKLEQEASELFRIAEEKEKEVIKLEENSIIDLEKQNKKVNEELLKKLHDANVEAKKIRNNALSEYEEVLVSAKEKADSIEKSSAEKSEAIIEKAKADAKEIYLASKDELGKAQEKATEVINYANDKSAQIHQEGLKELETHKARLLNENEQVRHENDELTKEKERVFAEIEDIKSSIETQKQQFKENMSLKREEVLQQAKSEAEQIIAKANKELSDANENVEMLHKAKIKETEDAIDVLKAAEKKRIEGQIHKEKELLAKLRAQEMENHKVKREQEEAELKNRKEQYADSIVKGIENLVNGKLQEMSVTKLKGDDLKVESEKIAYLVRASLLEKNPQNNELLKKLNPYGKAGKGKSTQLMRRIGIGAGVLVLLFLVNIIFPSFYSSIGDSFSNIFSVDESAKDLYLKGLEEKRESRPKFEPRQTDTFKDSYTDNIIYTSRFTELWPTDELQKAWTIKVDEIIVYKLKLKDYKVVKYISEEFKLIRNLINMSKKINVTNQKEQIEEMRTFEEKYRKRLVDLMNGKKNLKQMHSEQKKFFIQYKQKNPEI
ncbi:MAG: pSer/pThr/pTyr-binding forkhead associated (FHA) protein [Bacteriovoracaceae bacterium]